MLYRIFTEDTGGNGRATVNQIVASKFDGFTTFKARGYWKGIGEKSYVVEIAADAEAEPTVNGVAAEIRTALNQECVLVQKLACTTVFI